MSTNKTDKQNETVQSKAAEALSQKPIAENTNVQPQREFQISTAKPFKVLNFTFASRKVFTDFLLYSLLIVVIPVILVYTTFNYVKDNPQYSEMDKVVISVGPSLFLINVIIGVYVYKVIKDPQNYKKDPPIKPVIPVGLKEQNMDRRYKAKQQSQAKQIPSEKKQLETSKSQPQKPKHQ